MNRPLPYDEALLLSRLAQDDPAAFSAVFFHHFDNIYTAANSLLKDEAAAEDVCQQVFATLWEKRQELAGIKSLRNYLFIAARNLILNGYRKQTTLQKYRNYQLRQPPGAALDPEQTMIGKEQAKLMERAITSLSPKQQQAFRLSREKGLAYKDISRMMGISIPTVKEHISKSLASIRKFLSHYQSQLLPLVMAWLLK